MRIQPTRSLARLLALPAALGVLAAAHACSYDALTGPVLIEVHNIPSTADHLEVTLTDAAQNPVTRTPSFGVGSFADVELTFPAPVNSGVVTLTVLAKDHDQNLLGQLSAPVSANFDPTRSTAATPLILTANLVATGSVGSFGAACGAATPGAPNGFCNSNLECHKYNSSSSTEVGICTKSCTGTGLGNCDASPAGATCQPFPGTIAALCQWECDQTDGGVAVCPPGLVCGSQISGSTKRFCQAQ